MLTFAVVAIPVLMAAAALAPQDAASPDTTPPVPPTLLGTLQVNGGDPHAFAFSPNGNLLAMASYSGEVAVRNLRDGRELWRTKGHKSWIAPVAFSPDGALLASCSTRTQVWKSLSGEPVAQLESGGPGTMAWSPDGNYLAHATQDDTVEVRRTSDWGVEHSMRGQWRDVETMAYRRDGALFVGDDCGMVYQLDFDSNTASKGEPIDPATYPRHNETQFLGFHGDTLVAATQSQVVRIGTLQRRLEASVFEGALAPSGLVAAGGATEEVLVWNQDGDELHRLPIGGSTCSLAFDPTGRTLAVGTYSGELRMFRDGTLIERSIPHPGTITSIGFTGTSRYLVATGHALGQPHDLRVLDLEASCNPSAVPQQGGGLGAVREIQETRVYTVVASAPGDRVFFTGPRSGTLDAAKGKALFDATKAPERDEVPPNPEATNAAAGVAAVHDTLIWTVAIAGGWVVGVDPLGVGIFDPDTQTERARMAIDLPDALEFAVASPDGKKVAVGDGHRVWVFAVRP